MIVTAVFPPSERNQTADLLKGVAVILMIQVHLVEQFATFEIFQSSIGRVSLFLGGPPAAPVFLAAMGYFAARSRKPLLLQLRRGVLLMLGGIALNLGLNANLLFAIHQGRFELDPLAFIFGADILPLAGLSIIVIALMRVVIKERWLAYLFAAFLVAAVPPFLPNPDTATNAALVYIMPFFGGNAWWSYFPLFPWLAYTLLGFAFAVVNKNRQTYHSLSVRAKVILVIVVTVLLVATSPYAVPAITELHLYYHHGILLSLWITAFLGVWLIVASRIENTIGSQAPMRYLKWLGRNVTSAYVFQWLLIGNLATELYRTQSIAQVLGWFVAIMLATSILILIYQKSKLTAVTARASSV